GPRGGHYHRAARHTVHRAADMPHVALDVGVGHFEIGDGSQAARAPVDHVLSAVDEALFEEPHEDFADRAREAGVQGEALAAPIAARAEADHLALDGVAVLGLPLPHALLEFFAAHGAPVEALFGQFALDHHLGGDAGVVAAGEPQGVGAGHAVVADGDIDLGV